MKQEQAVESSIMALQEQQPGEQDMVQKERWVEIRRMFFEQRVTLSEIARRLDLDRKTVRRCIGQRSGKRIAEPLRPIRYWPSIWTLCASEPRR